MKPYLLLLLSALTASAASAQEDGVVRTYMVDPNKKTAVFDSVILKIDSANHTAYYQKTIKVDSSIKLSTIYTRVLEFMAAKDFQQTYGYEQEGKLIFSTTQDINANPVYGGENDDPQTFSVQFAITLDMKNGRYRYTISNVLFYLSSQSGSRRMPLFDMYQKETNGDNTRRMQRDAKKMLDAFEKYLAGLTGDLYIAIMHKAAIYDTKY